ncbi:MAG: tyrosine--tRNA ligase [Saprospiraceae bacterium]
MNFFEELEWRGMLHDSTPGAKEVLDTKSVVGYIGFDPTAKSLTIGNFVQVMLLSLFQKSGHKPIVLMGGATGRIGDPSGKDKERQLKSFDELDGNLAKQVEQMKKLLDFEGPNAAKIVNNLDFYKEMNVLDFLRNVGKTLTVNYMMSKDSVKNRLSSGLSFTEFSYQLLQAYDFQVLHEDYDCILQMGGSDQWGNITSGTEFIRRNTEGKAYAITTPLLTKSDGKKFGKSEEGNIWLDADMTSPYKFYQFWINADDADIPTFTRYFTFHTKEEIEEREKQYGDDPRVLKKLLAEELTKRVHSIAAFESVLQVSEILFNKKASQEQLMLLSDSDFKTVAQEIPSFEISLDVFENELTLIDLMTLHTKILSSKGEARRAIKNNAISINKEKIENDAMLVTKKDLLLDRYIMIENGKKNKFILVINK